MLKILMILCFFLPVSLCAQLNKRNIEKADGNYVYCYHTNGKVSTVEYHPSSSNYMAEGYSKAFDRDGKESYLKSTSRRGMISSVTFAYYTNGAVKSAYYSSHPDAGIQWYNETTYFDENGKIIGVQKDSWNDNTVFHLPDSVTQWGAREREQKKYEEQQEKERKIKEQKIADSLEFYKTINEFDENDRIIQYISYPTEGYRKKISFNGKQIIEEIIEYYRKEKGIHSIRRTYHKNNRIDEEFIYENQRWHYRKYSKKGILTEERLNQQ